MALEAVVEEERRKSTEKGNMKLVSIWIPKPMLRALLELVELGVFPSKSEAIRFAILRLLLEIRRERDLFLGPAATGR